MERTPLTQKQIEDKVRIARDSVWVVNSELQKLANGSPWEPEVLGNLQRNVAHLELVMADTEISGSGLDLSDLTAAINAGNEELARH